MPKKCTVSLLLHTLSFRQKTTSMDSNNHAIHAFDHYDWQFHTQRYSCPAAELILENTPHLIYFCAQFAILCAVLQILTSDFISLHNLRTFAQFCRFSPQHGVNFARAREH